MTGIGWSLVDFVSQLLERDEREALRGDLAEAGENAWQGLLDVLGLVIRRQAGLWKNCGHGSLRSDWHCPAACFLWGFSVSVSRSYQQFIDPAILKATGLAVGPGFSLLMCHTLLLVGWS
ncbi:MAG: hypothetical protein JWO80_6174 [Bryobacterales bacterium]|nr:hypothetical protein [Bryobacterales bacterium]